MLFSFSDCFISSFPFSLGDNAASLGLLPLLSFLSSSAHARSCHSEPDLRSTRSEPGPSLAQPQPFHIPLRLHFPLRPPQHAPVSPSSLIPRSRGRPIPERTVSAGAIPSRFKGVFLQ